MDQYGSKFSAFLSNAGDRPYRDLIRHHIACQSTAQLQASGMEEVARLPSEMISRGVDFVDDLNIALARDREFWSTATCRIAYEHIVSVANKSFGRSFQASNLLDTEPSFAWTLFQISTISFAYSASNQPAQRQFMGIARGLPFWSLIGFLYGLASYVYVDAFTSAPRLVAVGYGLSQLGYAILASGVLTGTFYIFRVTGRFRVFGLGLSLLAVGIVLSNTG